MKENKKLINLIKDTNSGVSGVANQAPNNKYIVRLKQLKISQQLILYKMTKPQRSQHNQK